MGLGWSWGDALQGGIGGGTAGAAFGPVGAGIGGGLGILAGGLLGGNSGPKAGDAQEKELLALAEEARRRGQPQQAAYSDFRTDQQDHLARLRALADGNGPSLASEMLRENTARATANQTAMAAGARGNPALAARTAMNNTAGMTAQGAQSMAMARAQEQLDANQQLGLGIYGARGQDEQTNQFNSNLLLQALANNDRTRLMALSGSLQGTQLASQQPGAGDYLMGAGGALGNILALAKAQKKQTQQPQAGGGLGQPYAGYPQPMPPGMGVA